MKTPLLGQPYLGGTWNVEGRYSNGSWDACSSNAMISSKRFVHLEQSYQVRRYQQGEVADYILDALIEYFQP